MKRVVLAAIILFIGVLWLFSGQLHAEFDWKPSVEYERHMSTARVIVSFISLILLSFYIFFFLKLSFRTFSYVFAIYVVVGAVFYYIGIFSPFFPHSDLLNIYIESEAYSYVIHYLTRPLNLILVCISIIGNSIALQAIKRGNLRNLIVLSLIQLPLVGVHVLFFVSKLYFFLFPFVGEKSFYY